MLKIFTAVWLLLPAMTAVPQSNEINTSIVIHVDGLRNRDGVLRALLFTNEDGFPQDFPKASQSRTVAIQQDTIRIQFDNVNASQCAISVLHDENDNEKMDSNWLGMPKEGIGVSNNVKNRLGPPSFEDAAVTCDGDTLVLSIHMRYF